MYLLLNWELKKTIHYFIYLLKTLLVCYYTIFTNLKHSKEATEKLYNYILTLYYYSLIIIK